MKLIAACAFGLEALVKRELIALGYDAKVVQPGRVGFEGEWEAVCEANLWLRTADRVLIQVQQFDAPDFDALFDSIKAFDWSQFIPADAEFPVIGKSRLSQLTSVPAVQRTVKKALVECLQKFHGVNELPETGALYKVEVALLNDVATLTIDTTGPSLHKRGYRKLSAAAPLKETLAAALVDLSVWRPHRALVDPFCGSGTIAIEAAMKGRNIAPGLNRFFAASDWERIDGRVWSDAQAQAKSLARFDEPMDIIGSDRDQEVLSLATYHARLAGVQDAIRFEHRPFSALASDREYGCIVTNPPYGERLEDQERLVRLYESIPEVIQRLPTWSLFLITNMPRFELMIQKRATRRRKLFNGRIECTYYQFLGPRPPRGFGTGEMVDAAPKTTTPDVATTPAAATGPAAATAPATATGPATAENPADAANPAAVAKPSIVVEVIGQTENGQSEDGVQTTEPTADKAKKETTTVAPIFGSINDKDKEQAGLFHNRLVKRARHLRRWPTKRGITCYRLYERDIPEIPLVVDRYENYLHITEYERPHDRDLARHRAWLELMQQTAADALELPVKRTFLKQRRKGEESGQYSKLKSSGQRIVVQENGLKFVVNLADYVDTGLFLDHRVTRKLVMDEAEGKRMLNLFAYTGAFSVYAAAGGAKSTTTVDLSRTYLEWAGENFKENELSMSSNHFIADDTIEYLESIQSKGRQFDLVVCDPPTYSNSKRTDEDWDVQHGYLEILELLSNVVTGGGTVYFSTNFRRFKFDDQAVHSLGFESREISKTSVPEDFRNRRIHRCWRLTRK